MKSQLEMAQREIVSASVVLVGLYKVNLMHDILTYNFLFSSARYLVSFVCVCLTYLLTYLLTYTYLLAY